MVQSVRRVPDFRAAVYESSLGRITLRFHAAGLSGLWFDTMSVPHEVEEMLAQCPPTQAAPFSDVEELTRRWLDTYFAHRCPDFTPPLHLSGTPFLCLVWKLLLHIPYGQTATYGELAKALAARSGRTVPAARAIGGAVGRNPVSLIVPCHRVVGAGGRLTGYAGGLPLKAALLGWESA